MFVSNATRASIMCQIYKDIFGIVIRKNRKKRLKRWGLAAVSDLRTSLILALVNVINRSWDYDRTVVTTLVIIARKNFAGGGVVVLEGTQCM